MAKALFHKNQRVYVKPVGTWASIERVVPQWVKGVDEPSRIFYDVGLGRDFSASELTAEDQNKQLREDEEDIGAESWRLVRARNKWQVTESAKHHPFPGTFPVVVTDEHDWGGWRVPGSEYDRDPQRIEFQARMIVAAPRLLRLVKKLTETASSDPDVPQEIVDVARDSVTVLRYVYDIPDGSPTATAAE